MLANDNVQWKHAMKRELSSIAKNKTWELVPLPKGRKALLCKWASNVENYKARLVAKGFKKEYGVDFQEIFPPVVKMTTLRMLLALVATENIVLDQMDVITNFLHGDLKEEIYMQQPEGFMQKGKEHLVCKLLKSLYVLQQSSKQWYHKFDTFMCSPDYKRSNEDPCLYVKRQPNG
ncbi:hypothetical protein L7F22_051837 [Adiantum nelumboides]|nr:hypothetical protein [Adiantum nelumboides]